MFYLQIPKAVISSNWSQNPSSNKRFPSNSACRIQTFSIKSFVLSSLLPCFFVCVHNHFLRRKNNLLQRFYLRSETLPTGSVLFSFMVIDQTSLFCLPVQFSQPYSGDFVSADFCLLALSTVFYFSPEIFDSRSWKCLLLYYSGLYRSCQHKEHYRLPFRISVYTNPRVIIKQCMFPLLSRMQSGQYTFNRSHIYIS